MPPCSDPRAYASGATPLRAGAVGSGHRLGDDVLEAERPLHVALADAESAAFGGTCVSGGARVRVLV